MKNIILILSLNILFSCFSFTQNYHPTVITGACWTEVSTPTISDTNGIFPLFNQFIYFTGFDTVFEHMICKSLHQNDYLSDSTSEITEYNKIGYLHEDSNKQISILLDYVCCVEVKKFLLYDFSKNTGDTIVYTTDSTDNIYTNKYLVVSDIDSILINNSYRKQFHFSGTEDIWIEGIGSIHGLLYPISGNQPCDCAIDLVCYKFKNAVHFLNSGFNDCFPLNTSSIMQNSIANFDLNIFPNPVYNVSTINLNSSCKNGCSYSIVNIAGEIVISGVTNNSEFSISKNDFAKGLYLFQVYDGSLMHSGKFIIY